MYEGLGKRESTRLKNYRSLFQTELEAGLVDEIRNAQMVITYWVMVEFKEEISGMLGRRVSRGKAGRPKKEVILIGV